MGDNPLLMTDIFTYISPLCLIALFFFCFCRFLARPCIASSSSRSSRSTNEFSATQGAAAITPSHRNERRRERNQRRRRSRTIPATVRVQPTGQLPPIHLISADFPEIMIVRPGDEPPKYEDAIKLKDATPPAYTPTITQTTTHTSSATTATAPSISTGHEDRERGTVSDCVHSVQSTESRTRDDPESSHAPIRRTHSLPHTCQPSSSGALPKQSRRQNTSLKAGINDDSNNSSSNSNNNNSNNNNNIINHSTSDNNVNSNSGIDENFINNNAACTHSDHDSDSNINNNIDRTDQNSENNVSDCDHRNGNGNVRDDSSNRTNSRDCVHDIANNDQFVLSVDNFSKHS